MRYIAGPAYRLSLLLTVLATRGCAFLLPVAASAIMIGEPPAPPPAAALASTKPDATGATGPSVPTRATGVAATVASAAASDTATRTEGGSSKSPSHLVVLSHGLAGTADDLTYLKRSLERAGGSDILVHSARCNQGKTKDGVVKGGTRLAKEILELVGSTPSLSRISLVGNSLGGLYVRFAAKLLYSDGDHDAGGGAGDGATIAGLKPSVFMTIACPHLGIRRFTYVPLPSMLHPLAGLFVGKTGTDLFLSRKSGIGGGGGGRGGSNEVSAVPSSAQSPPEPPSTIAGGRSEGNATGAGDGRRRGSARRDSGSATARDDGRESILLYGMATSEEFLRPLKAFRWRRAYANRHGDFMVPYGTAAFVEPNEGDGSAEAPLVAGGGGGRSDVGAPDATVPVGSAPVGPSGAVAASDGSAPAVGTESFTIADRLLGAKNGAIVGFSRVGPAAASGTPAVASGEQGVPAQHGSGTEISARLQGSAPGKGAAGARKDEGRRSMEEEMAAGLNSCGWEKVSVDFGSLAPFSHNKICALSRTPITTALYRSGNSVVDHAADFLVARDSGGANNNNNNNNNEDGAARVLMDI